MSTTGNPWLVLPWGLAVVWGRLSRPLRQQIGDLDVLIAATALHHGLTLLTRNLKDFQSVPDVAIYQPS